MGNSCVLFFDERSGKAERVAGGKAERVFCHRQNRLSHKKNPVKHGNIRKKLYLCNVKPLTTTIMTAIVERTPRTVTVRMSTRRWNRLQQMEQAYKLAQSIKRGMKQAETAPAMTVGEAMDFIDRL